MKFHSPEHETPERKLIYEIDWRERRITELNDIRDRRWAKQREKDLFMLAKREKQDDRSRGFNQAVKIKHSRV